jgi:hypothetical protein
MNKKKVFLNSVVIVSSVLLATVVYQCKNPNVASEYASPDILATHFNGEQFVGSETCIECHANIYASHLKTAHFKTSALTDSTNIKGSFVPGSNTLDIESTFFTMFEKEGSFYQHAKIKNRFKMTDPDRFDIVIGSGVRGQSYLTWKENQLFQLQTSYYTPTNSWVNSPGYPSYSIERPIRDACIKCHVTFAKNDNLSKDGNGYDRKELIYGIDCERCHRPAKKHVVYHRNNPEIKTAKYMMSFDTMSQQQRLDACAQCHSGLKGELKKGNSFSFFAGDNLNEYAQNVDDGIQNDKLDVHGNQYGLLTESQCFKKTATMNCATCHNPHENQRGKTEYFNQKCMECHLANTVLCKAEISKTKKMSNDCISCHMPTKPSTAMTIQLTNDTIETAFNIRTHLIAIYDE